MRHRPVALVVIASLLSAGALAPAEAGRSARPAKVAAKPKTLSHDRTSAQTMSDRDCMARAMYFESRRIDEDGMLAVGTVVANRLAASGRYGGTVCEVVGKKSQFAPGVLTRAMAEPKPRETSFRVAEAVLAGARHPTAGDAVYFHTFAVPFRHDDKRYVLVSGGNAFYHWNATGGRSRIRANLISLARAAAAAPNGRQAAAPVLASYEAAKFQVAAAGAGAAGTTALGSTRLAMAYAAAPFATPSDALAVVAALEPKRGPRVITPQAPVQAAAGPVFGAAAPPRPAVAALALSSVANSAVAAAWTIFGRIRR